MKKNVIFVTLTFTAFFLNIFSIDLILFQIEALKGYLGRGENLVWGELEFYEGA